MDNFNILPEEVIYLRELAQKQLEYANKPIMKEREKLWYAHNDLEDTRPLVVMEEITFWDDIRPPFRCTTPLGQEMENQLQRQIAVAELIDDDKVIPNYYEVELLLDYKKFGVEQKKIYAREGIGFHIEPVLEDLEEDLAKLSPSVFSYDKGALESKIHCIEEVIGDILPVRVVNSTNRWEISVTQNVIELMGMENMFYAITDTPDEFHQLMNFVTEDRIRLLRWEEENGCLWLNNKNDYMGSGSYCFTHDLPAKDFQGKVRSKDTWGHINSQETIGISPDMFREFILPYMKRTAAEFGLIYYGCCEPVSAFWERGIEEIKNLRKISISPWCDEEYMAERLSGSSVIYSRKPSPNFLGVKTEFDEEAFRKYIQKTVSLTKNCKTEYIFRDIYQLHGNVEKLKRAVEIVREETDK